jgi:hypothetical protein
MARPNLFLCSLLSVTLAPALACDESTNDFDCETTWMSRKDEVLEKGKKEYLAVANEHVATSQCRKDMLEAVPKGGKRAECKCIGRKAVH